MPNTPPLPTYTNRALTLLKDERVSHIIKGYSEEHDDKQADRSMTRCATYILDDYIFHNPIYDAIHRRTMEKLIHKSDWPAIRALHVLRKHSDPLKRVTIAGSLIVAEMERLLRNRFPGDSISDVQVPNAGQQAVTPAIAKQVKEQTDESKEYLDRGPTIPEFATPYYIKIADPLTTGFILNAIATFEEHRNQFWWRVKHADSGQHREYMIAFHAGDFYIKESDLTQERRDKIDRLIGSVLIPKEDDIPAALLSSKSPGVIAPLERQRLKVNDRVNDEFIVVGNIAQVSPPGQSDWLTVPGAVTANPLLNPTIRITLDAYSGEVLSLQEITKRIGEQPKTPQ